MTLRSWSYSPDCDLISSVRYVACVDRKLRKKEEQPVSTNTIFDVDEQPGDVWLQLSAVERAIMKFVRLAGDNVLTYALIAANMTMPRLPGDDKSDVISDRTVAKYCHRLECPPLELVQRCGKRSGIQLTAKGARLMRLLAKTDF
jgi:hypothetical protein